MLKLFWLGIRRFRSPENYQELQSYIAKATITKLSSQGIGLANTRVLELGAGHGGYSMVLREASKELVASDLFEYALFRKEGIPFVRLNVNSPLPFRANHFDLIYCSSLIEHIANPLGMLREAWRVLRPGGHLFLSFPPFYSLFMIGGHTFMPFHFLGERAAVRMVNLLRGYHCRDYATCYGDGTWGLYPLKIDQVKQLLLDSGFKVLDIHTRMTAVNTTRFPGILKDLATWHVCYIAQRPLNSIA